jgi:hypothetical protein
MRRASLICASFLSFAVTAAPGLAFAQSFDGVGLRAQGMGGAFVAVADDATATWWNPAGLATGAYFNAVLEYDRTRDPPETGGGIAVAFPALGLSYYRLPISEMRVVTSTDQTPGSRQDVRGLSQYGATAGQSLGKHLVVASTIKLVRAGETRGDLDLGAMASLGVVRLGLVVRNVRQPTFSADSGGTTLELPRQARAGAALVARGNGPVNGLALAVDADLTTLPTSRGDQRRVAAGLEVWAFRRSLGVRTGLSANAIGDSDTSISGGISLAVRSGTYVEAHATGGSEATRRRWGLGVRVTF